MQKIAALVAPALLASFSAIAAPEAKVSVQETGPNARLVSLDVTQICGAKSVIKENLNNTGNTIIGTYTFEGRPCGAGDIPQNQHVQITVDLADTAKVLGMKTQSQEFKAITKLDIK